MQMVDAADERVLEHYRQEAMVHELQPTSTMLDQTTRELEVRAILGCLHSLEPSTDGGSLLEIGCGNGFLLQLLRERFPAVRLCGADYSPDMVRLARMRDVERCEIRREDVRALTLPPASFDVVVSERCLINLPHQRAQAEALREIHRVLKPGGHLVLIEAFTDGIENLNRARAELGLQENTVPPYNLWFDKKDFLSVVGELFDEVVGGEGTDLPPRNFLSTHYFVSRVLYPAVTQREVMYNTEFVRFFRLLPPQGDYSPIQLYLMRKANRDGNSVSRGKGMA
jgi:ubiquinone/menaquinone biosynthesis C-methylase UbiE